MNTFISIMVLFVCVIVFFFFNPVTVRIRKIQSLLNKDRSVCDVINSLNGWRIDNSSDWGLKILINPVTMPVYTLYITYKNERPNNSEIKRLCYELTNENSIVTQAHKKNIPVEEYIEKYI